MFEIIFRSCADGAVPRPSIPQKSILETPYLGPNLEFQNTDVFFHKKKIEIDNYNSKFYNNHTDNRDNNDNDNNNYCNNNNKNNVIDDNDDDNNNYVDFKKNNNNNFHSKKYHDIENYNIIDADINNHDDTIDNIMGKNNKCDYKSAENYSEIYRQNSKIILSEDFKAEQRNIKNKNIVHHIIDDLNVNFEDNNTNYEEKNKISSTHCVVEAKVEKEVVVASQWFNGVDLVPIERTLPLSLPLSHPISHSLNSSTFPSHSLPLSMSSSSPPKIVSCPADFPFSLSAPISQSLPLPLPRPSPLFPSSTTSFSTSLPIPLSTQNFPSGKFSLFSAFSVVSEDEKNYASTERNIFQKTENNSQTVRAVGMKEVLAENEKSECTDESITRKKKRIKEGKTVEMDKEEKRKRKEHKKSLLILDWLDNIGVPIVDVGQRTSFISGKTLLLDCGLLLCHVLQKLDHARQMKENNENSENQIEIDCQNNNNIQNKNKPKQIENQNKIENEDENENKEFHSFCLDVADDISIFQNQREMIENIDILLEGNEDQKEENENQELKKLEKIQRALSFIAVRTSSSTLLSTCLSKDVRLSLLKGNSQILLRILNCIKKAYSPNII